VFDRLDTLTSVRALQCAEPGPYQQAAAALDIAWADMAARRAGVPLAQFLRPDAPRAAPAYASGIHPDAAEALINDARAAGFCAFKVKTGFGAQRDAMDLLRIAGSLAGDETLACDANQAWDAAQAVLFIEATTGARLAWLEEPIRADADPADWARVAAAASRPLAGGENIAGHAAFDRAIAAGALGVIQPDVAKWGGVSGCVKVARAALDAGLRYCPHFLGGAVGLAASAHVLAAAGGDGLLEVDVNPNPLRDLAGALPLSLANGHWPIADRPGLGIEDPISPLRSFVTLSLCRKRENTMPGTGLSPVPFTPE
jgi:L-alanine-DL-glutamate epimerase-like enolase superfamily enzyme